jgi:hypothetical protein
MLPYTERECLDPIDDLTRSINLEARDAEIRNPDKREFPTNFGLRQIDRRNQLQ